MSAINTNSLPARSLANYDIATRDRGTADLSAPDNVPSFKDMLSEHLKSVNLLQQEAGAATQQFVVGDGPEIHELMIAMQKASVGLELTVALRDKFLEAYRDIMRMQI